MAMLLNQGRHPFAEKSDLDAEVRSRILKGDFGLYRIKCSESALNLLSLLMKPYASERIDAASALSHPWLKSGSDTTNPNYSTEGLYEVARCTSKLGTTLRLLCFLAEVRKRRTVEATSKQKTTNSFVIEDKHNKTAPISSVTSITSPLKLHSRKKLPSMSSEKDELQEHQGPLTFKQTSGLKPQLVHSLNKERSSPIRGQHILASLFSEDKLKASANFARITSPNRSPPYPRAKVDSLPGKPKAAMGTVRTSPSKEKPS